MALFQKEYLDRTSPLAFEGVSKMTPSGKGRRLHRGAVRNGSEVHQVRGHGNGPVAAFVHGLNESGMIQPFEFVSYAEHSLGTAQRRRRQPILRSSRARDRPSSVRPSTRTSSSRR